MENVDNAWKVVKKTTALRRNSTIEEKIIKGEKRNINQTVCQKIDLRVAMAKYFKFMEVVEVLENNVR